MDRLFRESVLSARLERQMRSMMFSFLVIGVLALVMTVMFSYLSHEIHVLLVEPHLKDGNRLYRWISTAAGAVTCLMGPCGTVFLGKTTKTVSSLAFRPFSTRVIS